MRNIKFSEFDYLYGKGDLTNSTDFCFLGIPVSNPEDSDYIVDYSSDKVIDYSGNMLEDK